MPARGLYFKLFLSLSKWVEFNEAEEKAIIEKTQILNKDNKDEIVDHETLFNDSPKVQEEVYKIAYDFCDKNDGEYEILQTITDEFYNLIHVFVMETLSSKKSALLIIKPYHFTNLVDLNLDKDDEQESVKLLGKLEYRTSVRNKIENLERNGFSVLAVEEAEWLRMSEEEKQKAVNDFMKLVHLGESAKE